MNDIRHFICTILLFETHILFYCLFRYGCLISQQKQTSEMNENYLKSKSIRAMNRFCLVDQTAGETMVIITLQSRTQKNSF